MTLQWHNHTTVCSNKCTMPGFAKGEGYPLAKTIIYLLFRSPDLPQTVICCVRIRKTINSQVE